MEVAPSFPYSPSSRTHGSPGLFVGRAADSIPAFVSIQLGIDKSVWVREYPATDEDAPQRWIRFDAEGRFQCRSEIHHGLEVYEFGADYVLGKESDDLGVERVVLYEVLPQ